MPASAVDNAPKARLEGTSLIVPLDSRPDFYLLELSKVAEVLPDAYSLILVGYMRPERFRSRSVQEHCLEATITELALNGLKPNEKLYISKETSDGLTAWGCMIIDGEYRLPAWGTEDALRAGGAGRTRLPNERMSVSTGNLPWIKR